MESVHLSPDNPEALVQVTDKQGNLIDHVSMLSAFERGLIRNVVYVMLSDADGRYLLQKRSANVPNYANYWDPSAGGHVDEGEHAETAAYRELSEELGLADIALTHCIDFYFESPGDGRMYRYYVHLYINHDIADTDKVVINPTEVECTRFYTKDEINNLKYVTPITRHIITLL